MTVTPALWRGLSQVNVTDGGGAQSAGEVIGTPDGGYIVVWTDDRAFSPTSGSAVIGQKYSALGAKVGGEVRISQFSSGFDGVPPAGGQALADLHNGNIAVAYTDLVGVETNLFVRLVPYGVTSPGRVDSIDVSPLKTVDPSITSFASGDYVISYTVENSATDHDILVRFVSSTGTVGAPITIFNDTDRSEVSQLDTLSNGNFVVVWQNEHMATTDTDIWYSIWTPGGTNIKTAAFVSGAAGGSPESDPDVAALAGGGFVVAWTDASGDASGFGIRATIYNNAGTAIVSDFQVNTTTAGSQNEASIVALSDGNFVITWEDDTADVIRAQRFSTSGVKIGSEFTVKVGISTSSPDSALLSDGRFAYALGDNSTGDADVLTSIWDPIPPVITSSGGGDAANLFRAENTTAVTTVVATDPTLSLSGAPLAYSIVGGADAGRFQINASTGALAFLAAQNFEAPTDADQNNSYIVQVRATDGNLSDLQTITVNVTDAREPPSDFDGNDKGDILFQHDNGAIGIWLLDGVNVAQFSPAIQHPGPGWHARDSGDFNADGKADILWHNDDGTPAVWLFDGFNPIAFGPALSNPGPGWHQIAAADFNGDGKVDIFWQHDNGAIGIWLMDGVNVAQFSPAIPHPGAGWHAKDAADFNGDGKADILWQHDNGTPAVWLADGINITAIGPALSNPGPAWHIIAAADFNGDRKSDIVFQHDNGAIGIWLMDGVNVAQFSPAIPHPGDGWHIKDAVDTNGDGKADIIWQHDNGTPAVWTFDGFTPTEFGPALSNPGSEWHIV